MGDFMIFLNKQLIQIIIVIGVVIFFLGSFLLNKKIKAPKDAVLPEKCQNCTLNSCLVKEKTKEELKKEFKEYMENCDNEKK